MHGPVLNALFHFISREIGMMVILTLYMGKLRLSAVKRLCHDHTDSKYWTWDMNPVCCF